MVILQIQQSVGSVTSTYIPT